MNVPTMVLQGNVTEQAWVGRDVRCALTSDAAHLWSDSGERQLIPLADRPTGASKVAALGSIRPLLATAMVDTVEIGGDVTRVAETIAEGHSGAPLRLWLFNEADEVPSFVGMCRQKKIEQVSLGRIFTPASIMLPGQRNGLILTEPTRSHRRRMTEAQFSHIHDTAAAASAIGLVSPADWSVARALFSSTNGARKYLRPTGSLRWKKTLKLLQQCTDLVCNFQELLGLATSAKLCVRDFQEDSPEAPQCVAETLGRLHAKGLAGDVSSVVTMGRHGSVAADWGRQEITWLAFESLDDGAEVNAPAGTGDYFLGAVMRFNHTWAERGFLKEPVMSSVLRAAHYVARKKLRLHRHSYHIDIRRL